MRILRQLSYEQEAKITACNNRFEGITKDIAAIMESTRYTYGYSLNQFATLLGLSNYQYSRFLKKGTSDYVIRAIFKFCYIFDYDLQSLSKSIISVKDMDDSLMEIAVSLGAVPDNLIEKFVDVIKESPDMSPVDKRQVGVALQTYINKRHHFYESLATKDFSDVPVDYEETNADDETATADEQSDDSAKNNATNNSESL